MAADAGGADDLDLTGYERDVVEHALYGRARARMFEAVAQEKAWSLDLARGELKVGDATYAAQIIGTYSNADKTFLWAWANPGKADWGTSGKLAETLHARAELPGQAAFREAEIAEGWVDPYELAYVAGELAGGYPVFLARHDDGLAFILVTSAKLDVQTMSLAYLPGVLLDMSAHVLGDLRACVRRFATRLGFSVRDEGARLVGTRADGTFTATLDTSGRVVDVALDAGGAGRGEARGDAAP